MQKKIGTRKDFDELCEKYLGKDWEKKYTEELALCDLWDKLEARSEQKEKE